MTRMAVLGAAGAQAGAMFQGLARAIDLEGVVAVDRAWTPAARSRASALGLELWTADIIADRDRLVEQLSDRRLIINMAGPFYALGTAALDLAIAVGADYLDICDDSDATAALLACDEAAARVGISALVGMGSSPGMSNVLIRTALDALPNFPAEVEIAWSVAASDMSPAVLEHMFHCFGSAIDGADKTPDWEALESEKMTFPDPVGQQEVVLLGHPEPLTIPRFTRAQKVVNKGGISPHGHVEFAWLLSRLNDDVTDENRRLLYDVYAAFRDAVPEQRLAGSGLQIDVTVGGAGYRFASGATTTMEDATGIPAAAGTLLFVEGRVGLRPGVWAPECLDPQAIFEMLRRVSLGGGGLHAYEIRDGEIGSGVRIRDLLAGRQA